MLPFFGGQTQFSLTKSEFVLDRCRADMHAGRTTISLDEPSNNAPGSQESGLFQTFSQIVLSGELDPHWPDITLLTQRVLDACLVSAKEGSRSVLLTPLS